MSIHYPLNPNIHLHFGQQEQLIMAKDLERSWLRLAKIWKGNLEHSQRLRSFPKPRSRTFIKTRSYLETRPLEVGINVGIDGNWSRIATRKSSPRFAVRRVSIGEPLMVEEGRGLQGTVATDLLRKPKRNRKVNEIFFLLLWCDFDDSWRKVQRCSRHR